MNTELEKQLNMLANFQDQKTALRLEKVRLRSEAIPFEVKEALHDIEVEFADREERVEEAIARLEEAIKEGVVSHGETVKGEFLQAVYSKPRVTWDSKALNGYAAAHPEIEKFRKTGKPSVSIRVLKK